MADGFTIAAATDWLVRFSELVTRDRVELTELDSAVGDADHGSNMVRGLTAVVDKVGSGSAGATVAPPATFADLFKTIGMTLVSSVGGASGPLYGTFFLRVGSALGEASEVGAADLAAALRAGLGGVIERGKAELGDKTMVDALTPAVDAFEAAEDDGLAAAASAGAEAAEYAVAATASLVARKGRASYLGERSIGHRDPGAASTALLFRALADAVA